VPRFRLLIAAVLAAAVAVPATAAAAVPRAKTPAPLVLASSIAARYWGAVPCHGKVKIIAQQPLPAQLQRDSDAWVTFDSSLGANDLAAPAGSYTRCTVALGRFRWPTAASMRQDWDMLCMTMTHEFGHLLGHPHSAIRNNIMSPAFPGYTSEPELCRTLRPSHSPR